MDKLQHISNHYEFILKPTSIFTF